MRQIFLIIISFLFITELSCEQAIERKRQKERSNKLGEVEQTITLKDEQSLDINLEFPAGVLRLEPGIQTAVIEFRGEYDSEETRPEITYEINRGIGDLLIKTKERADGDRNIRIDDYRDNYWELKVPPKIAINFYIKSGVVDGELDFSALKVTYLEIETGAGSVEINFDKLNEAKTKIKLECGAAKFIGNNLCNANFTSFEFDGGVGASELDFYGEQKGEAEVDINFGVGSNVIRIGNDFDVKLKKESSFLAPFTVRGLEQDGDTEYYSPDFGRKSGKLAMRVALGIGHTSVRYEKGM
ncbi:hypothetical protein JW964_09415 [candidate division KSB1 bacterium]|nr:hypothetical protein [candidate division KSB1 bacterium]